jgi:glycosyltransferase involved in cell wall biosynthesis
MSSLVSVIVATYNSSPFVIETLESISKQSWKNIELIITDDFSSDNTVSVCTEWLNENKMRFIFSVIIRSEKNTGVPANANRGLLASKGVWIKFLGADDTLDPNCIENNMCWVDSNPQIKALFSRINLFKDVFEPKNLIETTPGIPYSPKGILASDRSAESQYKMLLLSDRIHFTPSSFLHRETLLSVGGFDERFRLLEDHPLWLNLTRSGYKLYFMDKITVNYRQHSKAINNTGTGYLVNPNYFRTEGFRRIYTYPHMPADIRLFQQFKWYTSQIFRSKRLNKNKGLNRFFLVFMTIYLNPFKYYIYFKKRLIKDLRNDEFYI